MYRKKLKKKVTKKVLFTNEKEIKRAIRAAVDQYRKYKSTQ